MSGPLTGRRPKVRSATRRAAATCTALVVGALAAACFPPPGPSPTTTTTTTTTTAPPPGPPYTTVPTVDAEPADGGIAGGVVSANGRYVAFSALASNLVEQDTNGQMDAFVWDTLTSTVTRQPHGHDDDQPDGTTLVRSISGDGRYVLFDSTATNLVLDDINEVSDVFVWDTQADTVTRQPDGHDDDQPDGASLGGSISADGRHVAFTSHATNLVPGDTSSDDFRDVFVWDTQTDTVTRQPDGHDDDAPDHFSYDPSISADGRYVAFRSDASNLVPGDTNGVVDVFVWDTQTDTVTRQPDGVDDDQPDGGTSAVTISADGRYLAFASSATNLVADDTNAVSDVFVWDTQTNTVTRQPDGHDDDQPDNTSQGPSISDDGRYVVFNSFASNLVPDDTNDASDVFVWDTLTDTVTRQADGHDGNEPDGFSLLPVIAGEGRYVALLSFATNLVAPDTGAVPTLYLWDRAA